MKKLGHTSAPQGKRVLIFFHNGDKLIGKFLGKKGNSTILTSVGIFTTKQVYKISILR